MQTTEVRDWALLEFLVQEVDVRDWALLNNFYLDCRVTLHKYLVPLDYFYQEHPSN